MTAGLEINEQTIYESTSSKEVTCSDIISDIENVIGFEVQWYNITVKYNYMLSSDTDILLNCLASPLIVSSHVGFTQDISLKFSHWDLIGPSESDVERLSDDALTNLFYKFEPAIQHININYMQDLAPNVFNQLLDFAENFIVEADQLIKIDVGEDLLSSDQTYDLLQTINDNVQMPQFKRLWMPQASFDSDDSCAWLANIIDQATALYTLAI